MKAKIFLSITILASFLAIHNAQAMNKKLRKKKRKINLLMGHAANNKNGNFILFQTKKRQYTGIFTNHSRDELTKESKQKIAKKLQNLIQENEGMNKKYLENFIKESEGTKEHPVSKGLLTNENFVSVDSIEDHPAVDLRNALKSFHEYLQKEKNIGAKLSATLISIKKDFTNPVIVNLGRGSAISLNKGEEFIYPRDSHYETHYKMNKGLKVKVCQYLKPEQDLKTYELCDYEVSQILIEQSNDESLIGQDLKSLRVNRYTLDDNIKSSNFIVFCSDDLLNLNNDNKKDNITRITKLVKNELLKLENQKIKYEDIEEIAKKLINKSRSWSIKENPNLNVLISFLRK